MRKPKLTELRSTTLPPTRTSDVHMYRFGLDGLQSCGLLMVRLVSAIEAGLELLVGPLVEPLVELPGSDCPVSASPVATTSPAGL